MVHSRLFSGLAGFFTRVLPLHFGWESRITLGDTCFSCELGCGQQTRACRGPLCLLAQLLPTPTAWAHQDPGVTHFCEPPCPVTGLQFSQVSICKGANLWAGKESGRWRDHPSLWNQPESRVWQRRRHVPVAMTPPASGH